jgi:hypothetical protein
MTVILMFKFELMVGKCLVQALQCGSVVLCCGYFIYLCIDDVSFMYSVSMFSFKFAASVEGKI